MILTMLASPTASTVFSTGGDALIVIGCFGLVAGCLHLGLDKYFHNEIKGAVRYGLYATAAAAAAGYVLYTGERARAADGTHSAGHADSAMVGALVLGTVVVIGSTVWLFHMIRRTLRKRRDKDTSEPAE